ncbi:hypothetical protein [Bradyrhizobium diazoefficiens]|nr:hypothetical protein XF15B_24250 [Bradyrhizobium diazoefficiens]
MSKQPDRLHLTVSIDPATRMIITHRVGFGAPDVRSALRCLPQAAWGCPSEVVLDGSAAFHSPVLQQALIEIDAGGATHSAPQT